MALDLDGIPKGSTLGLDPKQAAEGTGGSDGHLSCLAELPKQCWLVAPGRVPIGLQVGPLPAIMATLLFLEILFGPATWKRDGAPPLRTGCLGRQITPPLVLRRQHLKPRDRGPSESDSSDLSTSLAQKTPHLGGGGGHQHGASGKDFGGCIFILQTDSLQQLVLVSTLWRDCGAHRLCPAQASTLQIDL